MTIPNHPVFSEFLPFSGKVASGYLSDFIGSQMNERYESWKGYDQDEFITSPMPRRDDDYFEWISLLEAVKEAKDSFVFVELGAGYGRWSARAFKAAQQRKIPSISCILVEAEPVHARWAFEHMTYNGASDFRILQCAVGATRSKAMFVVENHKSEAPNDPQHWYGQSLNWTDASHHRSTETTYEGRPVIANGDGWGAIEVDVVTLDDVIGSHTFIDCINIDIQGAELDVIRGGRDALRKVRRLYIGTHNHEVEEGLRCEMRGIGWQCVYDYPCLSTVETEFGPIVFGDGAQSWTNPRL
ncbi:methyltransferase, FkbM family [Rhizobiales bacterium GAS191]|nr:methyltransferase, FkbM family [Rhizobiales bacterium GAS191]